MTERPPRAIRPWSALFIAAYAPPWLARQLATDLRPPVSKNRRPAHHQKATTPRRTQERQT
ncbi:hypothetical protein [Streptomyces sp. EN16]|uniref:hypothetical protein n=1 Tax=Streptomyces sp. EN16 TaxID=212773 RepID=UPI00114D2C3F|nr:hypothetical protein [Streptomyces sp. EN16]